VTPEISARIALGLGAFRLDVALGAPGAGVTAVLGPSGSGKSTLLRCLAGLEPAARGHIEVGGRLWLDSERGVVEPAHRRRIGLVFQDTALFPHLSVHGNLEYAARRARAEPSRVTLEAAIDWLGLGALLDRSTAGLSGGERQRVAIARALLAGPRLLLLDEPVASLDAPARAEILALLRRLLARAPVPVFYVTHSRSEALHLADHAVVLAEGRVRAQGPIREVALRAEVTALGAPEELGAVVEGEVVEVDSSHGLSTLRFPGGVLQTPGLLAPGERRRVEMLARDVSLALEEPRRTSILNVLRARVAEVREPLSPQPLIVLDVSGTLLLARISRRSLERLAIEPGQPVYAQVKAIAVVP
jgi:molybdate transport system ATP-binding protein